MKQEELQMTHKALIIVDVQNDFLPGGSLAVPHGDEIIPVINNLLDKIDKNKILN